jgi:uncharacterized protein (DUF2062 family)
MLFGRRTKLSISEKIRGFLWPRTGFLRSFSYLRHRLARLPGTPHSIAIGFACGAGMAFTPFMGIHIPLSAVLAWLLRGNILASALGTLVGNPWTYPFFLLWTYRVGCWVMGMSALADPFSNVHMMDFLNSPLHVLGPVFVPMIVGSIPNGLLLGWLSYKIILKLVEKYKTTRAERRHLRAIQLVEQRRLRDLAHEQGQK